MLFPYQLWAGFIFMLIFKNLSFKCSYCESISYTVSLSCRHVVCHCIQRNAMLQFFLAAKLHTAANIFFTFSGVSVSRTQGIFFFSASANAAPIFLPIFTISSLDLSSTLRICFSLPAPESRHASYCFHLRFPIHTFQPHFQTACRFIRRRKITLRRIYFIHKPITALILAFDIKTATKYSSRL